ncbi:MAG: HEAT repeat domain-containing protein [bacterium]|nr:HEAT repeat domain-containing protein [bacterium]
MANKEHLLTDDQIQKFILYGYHIVQTSDVGSLHETIYNQLESVYETEGNMGNNILPRIPEIRQVFEHPAVSGALTSLLGPGYVMNPHRHGHLNPAGGKGQSWHKDCYVFDHNIRHPRFHWVLAFYYPQDTTADMGASGVMPGMHAYKTISSADPQQAREEELPICGKAGTVALIHFDAWHRATPNISNKKRYMLKFQFARTKEPKAPTWNHKSAAWTPPETDPIPGASQDVWNWLCGRTTAEKPSGNGRSKPTSLEKHRAELAHEDETIRLNAAYALAAAGQDGIPLLTEAMQEETLAALDETTAKTPDNAHGTNPTAGVAAQALSVIGTPAVPALLNLLNHEHWWVRAMAVDVLTKMGSNAHEAARCLVDCTADEHWWVRRNAIEALGVLEAAGEDAISSVTHALHDPDYRVRRNAALTLAKIGRPAAPAVSALVDNLEDEDRYNRFYVALALRRINTPEAQNALLDNLFASRWCPITTVENKY